MKFYKWVDGYEKTPLYVGQALNLERRLNGNHEALAACCAGACLWADVTVVVDLTIVVSWRPVRARFLGVVEHAAALYHRPALGTQWPLGPKNRYELPSLWWDGAEEFVGAADLDGGWHRDFACSGNYMLTNLPKGRGVYVIYGVSKKQPLQDFHKWMSGWTRLRREELREDDDVREP